MCRGYVTLPFFAIASLCQVTPRVQVLQRCVGMAAGVSGSLAEVRTAKALLLLIDDMAFDTIADADARDADMVAPLPLQVVVVVAALVMMMMAMMPLLITLQETDGVFVDSAYNGSLRMLYALTLPH
jgi:hypothetical protein